MNPNSAHPARVAYRRMMECYQVYNTLQMTASTLEYDAMTRMPAAAKDARSGASFAIMTQLNNVCREAVTQYKIALPGVDHDLFDQLELANIREGARELWATRDLQPADQSAYIQAMQIRQQIVGSFSAAAPQMAASGDWKGYCKHLGDLLTPVRTMNTTVNRGHLPFDNAIKGHTSSLDLDGLAKLDEELRSWLPQLRRKAIAKQHSEFERLGAVRLPTKLPLESSTNARSEAMFREALDMTRFDWQRGQLAAGRGYVTMPPANDTKLAYPANGRQMSSSPTGALYASFHESGHAAYEQGVPAHLWELPAGLTDDKAFHEAMAFVFEMWMARDPRFADVASALLTQVHGGHNDGGAFDPDNLRRLNKVLVTPDVFPDDDARSLAKQHVRNDIDMLLGIIVTTRLEVELFDGTIKPEDLPTRILGLREAYGIEHAGKNAIADAKTQLMQNGQWPNGQFGYIPLYVPAIVWSAQIGEAITHDLGDAAVGGAFGSGELGPILGWLSDKLWSRGRAYETQGDLVHMATGKPITTDPLRRLFEQRYGVTVDDEHAEQQSAAFTLEPINAGNAGSGTRNGGGGGNAAAKRAAAAEKARLAKAKEDLRNFEECEALF